MAIQRCAQWTGKNLAGKPARGAGVDPEFEMNKTISKTRRRVGSHFEGECSLSVKGASHACYSSSAQRFAKRSGDRLILLGVILCSFVTASAFAQTRFEKANQQFAQGHFKDAISSYEDLVRTGQWSANLFYDLGNAYFRTGDFGHAILNYERATALERHHPEATANLQIARDEGRALELQQNWPERYLQFASVNQYSTTAAVAFWAGALCIVALIFTSRRSVRLIASSILSLSVFALAIFA